MKKQLIVYFVTFLYSNWFIQETFAKHKGAVVTNGLECAQIGVHILNNGGSAADAAIAATFCESLACSQLIGLGGGFLATIYIKENNTASFLNARETAPARTMEELYRGQLNKAKAGALAVGVPGTLKGLWELHQKYGKLEWSKLIEPSIELCYSGIEVTLWHANNFRTYEKRIKKNSFLREVFINPQTNKPYETKDKIRRSKLCETYTIISNQGAKALHDPNSKLLHNFIEDIEQFGGILTKDDMVNYEVEWKNIEPKIFRTSYEPEPYRKIFTAPLPGSGPLLEFFLSVLNVSLSDNAFQTINDTPMLWHKVIETFKFGFAERTKLGDPKFNSTIDFTLRKLKSKKFINKVVSKMNPTSTSNDPTYYGAVLSQTLDHGTAHLSVLAPNGDAVALTGSLNYFFGAGFGSPSTGIILNNQMADFVYPGQTMNGLEVSAINMVAPGKRPLSSMTPLVVTDLSGAVQIVAGSAGGAKITEGLTNFLVQKYYLKKGLTESISAPRVYHHLLPMKVEYEEGFNLDTINALNNFGHIVEKTSSETAITVIYNFTEQIYANFDPRRGGSVKYVN